MFKFTGISSTIKVGERNLTELSVRWADKVNEKFAYKINLFALRADDWEARNMDATVGSASRPSNPVGYDAVNRYGDDEYWDAGGDVKYYSGMGKYPRPGI